MRQAQEIKALPYLAKVYADRYNVFINIQGCSAYSDGHSITVPKLDVSTQELERVLFGFVAHEAGHIRFSDYKVLNKISNDDRLRVLVNILEDARIEKLMSRTFIGVYDNLELVNRSLYKTQLNDFKRTSSMPKLQLLFNYLMYTSQSIVNQYRDAALMSRLTYQELSCLINPQGLEELKSLLYENCPKLESTEQVYELAKRIDKLFCSKTFFVPDFRRFAIRYNLTSAFDQANCIATAALYGQKFDYPVLCPSQFLSKVHKIKPYAQKHGLAYTVKQLMKECYPTFLCPKPMDLFNRLILKPSDLLPAEVIKEAKDYADKSLGGSEHLKHYERFMDNEF